MRGGGVGPVIAVKSYHSQSVSEEVAEVRMSSSRGANSLGPKKDGQPPPITLIP